MKKMNVKVVGARRKKKRAAAAPALLARTAGAVRRVLMRPRLVLVGALAGFILTVGTPHVAWDYECGHQMQGIGTCRAASWCAYYGIQGRRIDTPEWGQTCDFMKFIRIDWARLLER